MWEEVVEVEGVEEEVGEYVVVGGYWDVDLVGKVYGFCCWRILLICCLVKVLCEKVGILLIGILLMKI